MLSGFDSLGAEQIIHQVDEVKIELCRRKNDGGSDYQKTGKDGEAVRQNAERTANWVWGWTIAFAKKYRVSIWRRTFPENRVPRLKRRHPRGGFAEVHARKMR